MGTRSLLWKILHTFKKRGAGELDLDVLLDLAQQSVLVGQTQVVVNFHHHLNFMAAITGDKRRAEDLLKQNKSNWPAESDLFGRALHKNLVRKAKANKESANLRQQFHNRGIGGQAGVPFQCSPHKAVDFVGAKQVRGFRTNRNLITGSLPMAHTIRSNTHLRLL